MDSGGRFGFPDKFGAFWSRCQLADGNPEQASFISRQKNPKFGDFGNGLHQYYPGSLIILPKDPCFESLKNTSNESTLKITNF